MKNRFLSHKNKQELIAYGKETTPAAPAFNVHYPFEAVVTFRASRQGTGVQSYATAQSTPVIIAHDLALAPFDATLKKRMFPFLSSDQRTKAIARNFFMHPGVSGVNIDTILDWLSTKYVDLADIESSLKTQVSIDLYKHKFVEAVHQFQQKCFTDKAEHDGLAGPKVLHSLGIVQPSGKNPYAIVNTSIKPRIEKHGFSGSIDGNTFNHTNWFDFIVNPSVFGWASNTGIHYELAKKLRQAENWLLQNKFKGISPAELGDRLSITEEHKGYRATKTNDSQHNYGLGIDINYERNPFVRGGKILEVIKDAALLLSGTPASTFGAAAYVQKYWFSLSKNNPTTPPIYSVIRKHHADFVDYLSLANLPDAIKTLLSRSGAPAGLVNPGETIDAAAIRWQKKIKAQLVEMKADQTFQRNDGSMRDPMKGFLQHSPDLVYALRDQVCLAWGAVDFGEGSGDSSGDMMHFDMRSIPPYSQIADTAIYHPCRSSGSTAKSLASKTMAGFSRTKGGDADTASAVNKIIELVTASNIQNHNWTDREKAPIGYLKGIALTYARVYCNYKSGVDLPESSRDKFTFLMAKGVAADANKQKDAVAKYADKFLEFGGDVANDGVAVLRGLFTILIGLGMRESAGKHCVGWDRGKLTGWGNPAKKVDPTATNSEAGLYQISYDIGMNAGNFKELYDKYKTGQPSSLLEYFSEGATCKARDAENYGTGAGMEFQKFSKDCPAFTVELAALALRTRANHWGPINKNTVELLQECWALFLSIETMIDTMGGCADVK